jgi:hypothetical protein
MKKVWLISTGYKLNFWGNKNLEGKLEIEIKKKLVADLLEDPECRKEAINILIENKNSRDFEIRGKYKKLKMN